ncbi:hypothetical protein [Dongia deserti]|uniref:hypothetical protein n=1 Tax=Dongia deserti TaxID=2268030 RepID=UPI0013C4F418|nr:hypothetical protein [Dongia deserti]
MRSGLRMLAATAVLGIGVFSGLAWAQQASEPGTGAGLGSGCHFGEAIDGSTADDARRKIEAAGFTDVHALKKSCDNFWHGKATLAGRPVNVALSPAGKVMLEGD